MDLHQVNLQPHFCFIQFPYRFSLVLTFLGVRFDRTFSFSAHVFALNAKFFPRLKASCCISVFSWGTFEKFLSLYKGFLRPILTYAFLFSALPTLLSWNAFTERPVTSSSTLFRLPQFLSEASLPPLRVTVTHFDLSSYSINRSFVFQPPLLFQVWSHLD